MSDYPELLYAVPCHVKIYVTDDEPMPIFIHRMYDKTIVATNSSNGEETYTIEGRVNNGYRVKIANYEYTMCLTLPPLSCNMTDGVIRQYIHKYLPFCLTTLDENVLGAYLAYHYEIILEPTVQTAVQNALYTLQTYGYRYIKLPVYYSVLVEEIPVAPWICIYYDASDDPGRPFPDTTLLMTDRGILDGISDGSKHQYMAQTDINDIVLNVSPYTFTLQIAPDTFNATLSVESTTTAQTIMQLPNARSTLMGDRKSHSIYTLIQIKTITVIAFPGMLLMYHVLEGVLHETYRFVGHPLFPVNVIGHEVHTDSHICFQHMNHTYHVNVFNDPKSTNNNAYIDLPQTRRWVYDPTRATTAQWQSGVLNYADFIVVKPAKFNPVVTPHSNDVGTYNWSRQPVLLLKPVPTVYNTVERPIDNELIRTESPSTPPITRLCIVPQDTILCETHDRLGVYAWSPTGTVVYSADQLTKYPGRQLLPIIGDPDRYVSIQQNTEGRTTVTVHSGEMETTESVIELQSHPGEILVSMLVYRQLGTIYVARCMSLCGGEYHVYIETGGDWAYRTSSSSPMCLHASHTIDHETILYVMYREKTGVVVSGFSGRVKLAVERIECDMSDGMELESFYVGSDNVTNTIHALVRTQNTLSTRTLKLQTSYIPVLDVGSFVISDQVLQSTVTDVSTSILGAYKAVRFTSSGQACCLDTDGTLLVIGRPIYVPAPPNNKNVFLTADGRVVYEQKQQSDVCLRPKTRYTFSEPGRLFVATPSTYRDMYAIRDFMPHSASFFQEVERASTASVRAMEQIVTYCGTPYAQGDVSCACLNNQQLIRSTFGLADDVVVETSPYAALVSVAPCYAEKCVSIRGQQPPTYMSARLSQIDCPQMITVCSMLNSGSVGGHAISMCGNIGTNPTIETVPKPTVPPVPGANGLSTGWIVGIIVACVGVVLGVGIYWRGRTKASRRVPE